eukprot:783094-Prymnesium_polylepis.1
MARTTADRIVVTNRLSRLRATRSQMLRALNITCAACSQYVYVWSSNLRSPLLNPSPVHQL